MSRQIQSESKIFLKAVDFEHKSGGYLIGNCDMDIGIDETMVRIIPPADDADGEVIILNGTYTNEEFERYMGGDLKNTPFYYYGKVNIDVRVTNTVWRFFDRRYDSDNVLVIARTQPRGKRVANPFEVKMFLHKRDLRRQAA